MDGRIPLLRAVAEGRISRANDGKGYASGYLLDGTEEVVRMQLAPLARMRWIDLPMIGAPVITPDGQKWLSEQT